MFKRSKRAKSFAADKNSNPVKSEGEITAPPQDVPPPPIANQAPPPKIFRPSHAIIRIHELRLVLQNNTRKIAKGDILYYEWSIDGFKDLSTFVKVRNTKWIKWPKTATFSFQTLVYTEEKGGPYIKDKFIKISFRKAEKDLNSESDPIIGTLKLDFIALISEIKEVSFKKTRNEKFLVAPPSDRDETYTTKISTRTKLGAYGQTHIDVDNTDFSESEADKEEESLDGENKSDDDINTNNLEIQVEHENLKKKFQELVTKKEHEKREFEKAVKIWVEEKQKLETQLREVLAGKGDSLNLFLMKKIEDLETQLTTQKSGTSVDHLISSKKQDYDSLKQEYKKLKKSDREKSDQIDKLKKSFDKFKDDIANSKTNNIQKQYMDENKRLKKLEQELFDKNEKLMKQMEDMKTKNALTPKITTKQSQIQLLQTELHQKKTRIRKNATHFTPKNRKIQKNYEK